MKATPFQVFFAEDWLARLWIGGFVLSTISALLAHFLSTFEVLGFSFYSVVLAFAVLMGGFISYLASLIWGSCVLPLIYRIRERINGAPFETGDVVEILRRPHRGQIARIISAGNAQYGASVRLIDNVNDGDPLNIAWHSIRRLTHAEQVGGCDGEKLHS